MAKYSKEVKEQAISLYVSGLNGSEVGAALSLNPATVCYWCRKAGVIRHRGPQSKIKDEQFFRNIDTEDKAYWLGWLIADGNISDHNNQYSIKTHIALKDKELIYSFRKAVKSTNSIQERESSVYMSLTSKEMYGDLVALGLCPRKSGIEVLPNISKDLRHHMIRGYFDGDGITCVGKSFRSGFCGSVKALNFIRNESKLFHKIYKAKGTHYLLIGKKESRILYHYLYDNMTHGPATLWLRRKRKRMNIICGNTEVTSTLNRMLEP